MPWTHDTAAATKANNNQQQLTEISVTENNPVMNALCLKLCLKVDSELKSMCWLLCELSGSHMILSSFAHDNYNNNPRGEKKCDSFLKPELQ